MIKVSFKRGADWPTLGQSLLRQQREAIKRALVSGLREMQNSIMLTPVYTGTTLINYRWSVDSPSSEARKPVKNPALPGKTSEMELGGEPRRAAQAAVVAQEFQAVLAALAGSPYRSIYLTNNTPYFDQVEYGTYSTSEGHTQRTPPGGMVRRGEAMLESLIPNLKKKGGDV